MRLLLGADADVALWTANQIPHMRPLMMPEPFGPCAAIGVVNTNGDIIGSAVFHNYMPKYRSIEMSGASASKRWLTRSLLSGIFAYPFEQLKCQRITMIIPKRNKPAIEFARRLGFKFEGCVRRGFGNDAAIIYGLLASDWQRSRFCLKQQHQERAA